MSFNINSSVDSEKVFIIRRSALFQRLDPAFYRPLFQRHRAELDGAPYTNLSLGNMKAKLFQGVGRNVVDDSPIRLLKVKNITSNGHIDFRDTEPVGDVPKSKVLHPGDIITPFIGAAIKQYKFALFEGSDQPYTVDNNTGVIRLTDERLSIPYLMAFFRTRLIRWQLDQLTGGGGVPFLGSEYARRIQIPIPPHEVQSKIVTLLTDAEEKKREAYRCAQKTLEGVDDFILRELGIRSSSEQPNRIFHHNFRTLTGRRWDPNYHQQMELFLEQLKSSRFPIDKLNNGLMTVQYGISERATDEEVGVPMLRMINLQDNSWDLSSLKYIRLNQPEMEPYLLRAGDVLFNRTNSKELVGKCNVFDLPGDYVFASYLMRVRAKESILNPKYLVAYMASSVGRLQIDAVSRQIAGMANINAEELRGLLIPLPPLSTQDRISKHIEEIRTKANAQKQQGQEQLQIALRTIEQFILHGESQ